jgi:drug/metabolite transporter (DMT)-like permease
MPAEVSIQPARGSERLQFLAAFFAIYIVWGSTYLAIRIAVESIPPFLAAGIRFFLAGLVLYIWCLARGVPHPTRLEWRNSFIVSAFMFLAAYSCLFWAEKTVPSGIASVLVATIPVWTALLEIFVLKKEPFRWSLLLALSIGILGVAILTHQPSSRDLNVLACLVVTAGGVCWAIGTVASKNLALPASKVLSAGAQMTAGGVMLLLFSALAGELHPRPHISLNAAYAIAYLTVAGSILAFTAYVWLIGRLPATTVTSYAYVNPVVALLLGHWLAGEVLGLRTVIGAALILASVLLITTRKSPEKATAR